MLDLETRTGGVGWMPARRITTDEAMQVLRGNLPEDGQCRNACQWALNIFDQPDFVEDMPIDAKQQLFELVANNPGTRYSALFGYVRDQIDVMVNEYNKVME